MILKYFKKAFLKLEIKLCQPQLKLKLSWVEAELGKNDCLHRDGTNDFRLCGKCSPPPYPSACYKVSCTRHKWNNKDWIFVQHSVLLLLIILSENTWLSIGKILTNHCFLVLYTEIFVYFRRPYGSCLSNPLCAILLSCVQPEKLSKTKVGCFFLWDMVVIFPWQLWITPSNLVFLICQISPFISVPTNNIQNYFHLSCASKCL